MDEEALRQHIDGLCKSREETQVGLARLINVHPTAFSKWLRGKRQLKASEADTLRAYLGFREEKAEDRPHMLPMVGLIAAGRWAEGFEEVRGYMPSPDKRLSRDAFVVIVEGDSMDKVAQPGDGIIVDPRDLDLIASKFYVVRNSAGETTFKQYQDNPARLEPCSNNPAHQTIYPGRDEFMIVGRVRKRVEDL